MSPYFFTPENLGESICFALMRFCSSRASMAEGLIDGVWVEDSGLKDNMMELHVYSPGYILFPAFYYLLLPGSSLYLNFTSPCGNNINKYNN